MKWGVWCKRLALLAVALMVGLLAVEVVMRVMFRQKMVLFPRFHSDAQYGEFTLRRFRPNTTFRHTSADGSWEFRINAQGFRADKNFSYEKPAGCVRVLCLGDSQTAGFECRQEHTFSAVIEQYFATRGQRAEVINTGVSGFGTSEELALLENEGVKYHPDFVVLGFYANDFDDSIRSNLFNLKNGVLVTTSKSYAPGVETLKRINDVALLRWLSQHSYLYSVGLNGLWEYKKRHVTQATQEKLTSEMAVRPADLESSQYQQDLVAALVARMHSFCRAHDMKLIVLDITRYGRVELESSIPKELRESFRKNSDAFIESEVALADYRGLGIINVPNGHHHITEHTHLVFGVEIAKAIQRLQNVKPTP
jgi:lysophospholipase L1-like esterase